MTTDNTLIKKNWRLIVFILGLFICVSLIWAFRNVLMPFIIGFILAYLLLPIIRWVEKRLPGEGKKPQLKRVSIIIVVYVLSLAVIGAIVFYVIAVMGKSLLAMAQDAPQIIPNGLAMISKWLKSLSFLSSLSMQQQIDTWALQASVGLGNALQGFLTGGLEMVKSSAGMILGFAILPIFVFLILKDWGKLRDRFYAALPAWTREHAKSVFSILQHVVMRYIRGQLMLGLAVGICSAVLLFSLGIEFALPLAVLAGITEMVPMIGQWIGGGVAVIVTLSTSPEKVICVGVGYLVIQLIENNLLVPKIQGSQMQIHPALIIILSVLGAYVAGILGFIIVLPLTMTVLGIFRYLRDSARDGRFNQLHPAKLDKVSEK
jgi:predicted PurR-regulated permease PerM